MFLSLLFLIIVLSSASCEKDPEPEQDPKKLIVGIWQRTSVEYAINGIWRDVTQSCNLDDTEEYSADGKWVYAPGTDLCTGQTGNGSVGTYRFTESDTKLIFTYTHASGEYTRTIDVLDDQNMVLTHDFNDVNNTLVKTTYVRR